MLREGKLQFTLSALFLILLLSLPAAGQGEPGDTEPTEPLPEPADLSVPNDLVREQKYEEAERALAALQQDHPDDPRLLLMRGEVLLAIGRAEQALELLQQTAAVDPERPRLHFQLGTARAATGDRAGALQAFARELELNDDVQVKGMVHLNRSLLFQQDGKWDDAVSELERVLELEPERVQIFGDLASLQLQAGKADAAAETLERARAAGFESSPHQYSLGARLYRDGRYEPAVEAFRKALEIEPTMASAERSLAAALEKLGRDDEAIQHLRRYLELVPDAWDADTVRKQLEANEGR